MEDNHSIWKKPQGKDQGGYLDFVEAVAQKMTSAEIMLDDLHVAGQASNQAPFVWEQTPEKRAEMIDIVARALAVLFHPPLRADVMGSMQSHDVGAQLTILLWSIESLRDSPYFGPGLSVLLTACSHLKLLRELPPCPVDYAQHSLYTVLNGHIAQQTDAQRRWYWEVLVSDRYAIIR